MLPKAHDLGQIKSRILLFGGPYSNLAATQAMLAKATELDIDKNHIICTGDIVAYCAEPELTSQLIKESGIAVVMGNCEESLSQKNMDCGCGFEPGMMCSTLSKKWYDYADAQITDDSRLWMDTLPPAITFQMNQYQFRVIHGGVQQINQFIFASTESQIKKQDLEQADTDIIIGGHSGLPFGQKIGLGGWLNSGVIGLPANDGTSLVWYLLLTPDKEGFIASWHQLEYDYKKTAQSMLKNGLTEYAETVLTGFWPSQDILPEAEKMNRGREIQIANLAFK